MTGRRIGVYVCQCGGNISDYVDVDRVREAVGEEDDVVVARTAMFTCSDATQQEIFNDIKEHGLDGLVVASCSPKLHTVTFRGVAKRAGLNPYRYTQVNLSASSAPAAHTDDHEGATDKAVRLVHTSVSYAPFVFLEPLEPTIVETVPKTLVVGAEQQADFAPRSALPVLGLTVVVIEREAEVGGSGQGLRPHVSS